MGSDKKKIRDEPQLSSAKPAAENSPRHLPATKRIAESRPPDVVDTVKMVDSGDSLTAPIAGEELNSGEVRWEIGREIARGGMGIVYEARDSNLKRGVAVKVLHARHRRVADAVRRFLHEAEITAELTHPGIVPIYEVVSSADPPYYAMKKVEGRTLAAILKDIREGDPETPKQYPITRLLAIFQRVCDAVAYAHDNGVIHRDLKPDNIMLGRHGEVLVMDWGLAKRFETAGASRVPDRGDGVVPEAGHFEDVPQMTMDGQVMGTPNFMAPEQAQGRVEALDTRTDVYALGGILYNILTLHPPVIGANSREVVSNVIRGDILPPGAYSKTRSSAFFLSKRKDKGASGTPALMHCPGQRIPPVLQLVTMKALATNPDARYQCAGDLSAEVEAYLDGFATKAEAAGPVRQVWLFARRHKALVSVVAGIICALSIGLTIALHQRREAVLAKQEALRQQRVAESERARAQASEEEVRSVGRTAAPEFVAKGERLIIAGEHDEAREAARIATGLNPQSGPAWRMRGRVQLAGGKLDSAADMFSRSAKVGDDLSSGYLAIVRNYRAKRDSSVPTAYSRLALADEVSKLGDTPVAAALYNWAGHNEKALEKQLAAATKTLIEDNPGLKPGHIISRINLRHQSLTKRVYVRISRRIRNISALSGVPVTSLSFRCTSNMDLTPLADMPLGHLNIDGTGAEGAPTVDLTPLRGLPLKTLSIIGGCVVKDLSPLEGMPIGYLRLTLDKRKILDLSPLNGMPLGDVALGGKFKDLSAFNGTPLRKLNLCGAAVKDLDLSPLQGAPLEQLCLPRAARVQDISPLAGCPLKYLAISVFAETSTDSQLDLSPLKEMPLVEVYLPKETVRNLTHEETELLRGKENLAAINFRPAWVTLTPKEERTELLESKLRAETGAIKGRLIADSIRDFSLQPATSQWQYGWRTDRNGEWHDMTPEADRKRWTSTAGVIGPRHISLNKYDAEGTPVLRWIAARSGKIHVEVVVLDWSPVGRLPEIINYLNNVKCTLSHDGELLWQKTFGKSPGTDPAVRRGVAEFTVQPGEAVELALAGSYWNRHTLATLLRVYELPHQAD